MIGGKGIVQVPRRDAAQRYLGVMMTEYKRPKKVRPVTPGMLDRMMTEARRVLEAYRDDDREVLENASHSDLVGLYILFHTHVYGVQPSEMLTGNVLLGAKSAAEKLLREEFQGSIGDAIEWIRWCWAREKATEDRRRKEGKITSWRILWRTQFVERSLVTDYRIARARAGVAVR